MKLPRTIFLRLGKTLMSLGMVGIVGSATAGYLRVSGPARLKWQASPPLRQELLHRLPPLASGEEKAPAQASHLGPSAADSSEIPGNTSSASSMDAGTQAPLQANPEAASQGISLSPEWLATLFYTPSGSNSFVRVPMSLGFTPPQPAMLPSSSATYSTNKP